MEDAMIINQGSYDRGFKHGCVYKTKIVDAGTGYDAKQWKYPIICEQRNHEYLSTAVLT